MSDLRAPMQGTISWVADVGARIPAGRPIVVIESMKMEHDVVHDEAVEIVDLHVIAGATVASGQVLVEIRPTLVDHLDDAQHDEVDRVDLSQVVERHRIVSDSHRSEVVERRHRTSRRTARENLADLVEPGSFVEYGPLVIAAQRRRRPLEDLIERTPADGLVGGVGDVNGSSDGTCNRRAVVMSYDYTVLAGTQGQQNHRKKDRLFDVAARLRLPVVLFAEGGGGRPGDTDGLGVSGLDCWAFHDFAKLSGLVPLVGIAGGYCFAGNAALLGCCDVVIALSGSNIGMGGPAMIEGGGLGVHAPESIGPTAVHERNGVVDVVVSDDAEAVEVAKKYLDFFQCRRTTFVAPPQESLRDVVPIDRKKAYDIRSVVQGLFDVDSVLELRRGFGAGMFTALARLEGMTVGVVANDPRHLAGAIDSDGADKAARFMQLCDAFDVPIVTLVDTPGMMVGPEVEETALVRHCSRLFVTGVNVAVPVVSVVIRKSYGLGAQAMMAGSTKAPLCCVAWPTGEFGGMGLEGAVRLGYRKELEAIDDPNERETVFQQMVDRMYEHGKAVSVASHFEIDDVIDPADTRRWLATILGAWVPPVRGDRKRPNVDTW
ncbi:MAG: biotin carboxylase [Actinomycetota bacterium]|nr:biotin carboxylase [Actinomycetota bacterium]MDA2971292.1 biotin carboxylase [Actinomycetota bacterium]MDA3001719.1 biotin carboxylase [Actinomycetota bacterium]